MRLDQISESMIYEERIGERIVVALEKSSWVKLVESIERVTYSQYYQHSTGSFCASRVTLILLAQDLKYSA
jgi:hypothetical protein